jgi:hypothetical protein
MEENNVNKLIMSLDFPRKDKDGVKVKVTACGNTKEEFEENLAFMKGKAFNEM